MKRLAFFFLLICLIFAAVVYFIAIPKTENKIQTALKDIGFSQTGNVDVKFSLHGAYVAKINLDDDGFNYLEGLKTDIFWPSFIFNSTLENLTIDKIQIISGSSPYKNLMRLKHRLTPRKINAINLEKLKIKKIIWNTPLAKSAIRFEAKALLEKESDNNRKKISFSIKTTQHELAFQSQWQGWISSDDKLKLDGRFEGIKVNLPSLRINRGAGWVAYDGQGDSDDFSGEIEAGSGALFNFPLKNIAATIGQNQDMHPLLFRAEAAGLEGVRLSADVNISQNTNKQNMQANLQIDDFNDFLLFLKEKKLIQNAPIVDSDRTHINLIFLPERRFAEGPLPFQASVVRQNKAALDGTLLLYPKTLNVRGTLNSNNEFIDILKSITPLKDSQINDNVIRIDENFQSILP